MTTILISKIVLFVLLPEMLILVLQMNQIKLKKDMKIPAIMIQAISDLIPIILKKVFYQKIMKTSGKTAFLMREVEDGRKLAMGKKLNTIAFKMTVMAIGIGMDQQKA